MPDKTLNLPDHSTDISLPTAGQSQSQSQKKSKAKYEIGSSVRVPSLAIVSRESATAQNHVTELLQHGPGYARKNAAEPTLAELKSIERNEENFSLLKKAGGRGGEVRRRGKLCYRLDGEVVR